MLGYTSKTRIENYLLTNIDASFDEQVEDWIEEMEQYINTQTGRVFIADDAASVRVFDGDGTGKLLIDDCVAVEEVRFGTEDPLTYGESGEDDDYYLYPLNLLPKTMIKLAGGTWGPWPSQHIKVKAKWGYSVEVPADIRNITTILVAGIINYGNNSEGEVKSVSIGRYSVTYKDEAQWNDFARIAEVINKYKKYSM